MLLNTHPGRLKRDDWGISGRVQLRPSGGRAVAPWLADPGVLYPDRGLSVTVAEGQRGVLQ